MIIADTPEKIALYRMHVLEKKLKLEMLGIKFKGITTVTFHHCVTFLLLNLRGRKGNNPPLV